MRVYMQLQKELEKKNISKNAVIRKTGIDRSTFYQIMSCYATKYPSSIRGFCNGLGSPTSITRLRERVVKNGTLFSMAAIDRG